MSDINGVDVNLFLDDGALHLKLHIEPEVVAYAADGTPTYAPFDPAMLATLANGLKHAFTEAGFTWRRDAPRQYGGGGKREAPKVMETNPETGTEQEVRCPQCQGEVWDNREENKKRLASGQTQRPQYACKKKQECGWVMWPPRERVA